MQKHVSRNGKKRNDEGPSLPDFGCPDCTGVLTSKREAGSELITFRCTVGHVYTGETLLPVKEDQVETAIWSAVETYEEIAVLQEYIAGRARKGGHTAVADAAAKRVLAARLNAQKLRAIVESDGPAHQESRLRGRP